MLHARPALRRTATRSVSRLSPCCGSAAARRSISCGDACAADFTPSPYDCRPEVAGSGSLRTGGHATQDGAPLAASALETPAVWAIRVEHGIYRLGVSQAAASSLSGIGFVDLAELGSVLTEGRPFGMVEGAGGILGLVSSISGEVISVNSCAMEDPTSALVLAPKEGLPWPERGWLVEVDGYLEDGDDEDEWDALPGYP